MKTKIGKVIEFKEYNRNRLKYGYLRDESTNKKHYFDEASILSDERTKIKCGVLVTYKVDNEFNEREYGYRKGEASNIRLINDPEIYKINKEKKCEIEKKEENLEEFEFDKNINLYADYLEKIEIPLKKYLDISYFFDYFDPRWTNIKHESNNVDKFSYSFISSFKGGGRQKTAIDLVISRIQNFIIEELREGHELEVIKKSLVFMPVLASCPTSSQCRYLDFCNIICDYFGIKNGIYAYKNHPKKTPKHISGKLDENFIYELKIDSELLRDKIVFLFDDITTEGETLNAFEEKINKVSRPKRIIKLALGRTLKNQTLYVGRYTNSELEENSAFENLNLGFDSSIIHKKILEKNSFQLEKIELFKNWEFCKDYRKEVNKILENSLEKINDEEIRLDIDNRDLNMFDYELVSNFQSALKLSPKLLVLLVNSWNLLEKDYWTCFAFGNNYITILDIFRDMINLILEKKGEILIEEVEEIYKKNFSLEKDNKKPFRLFEKS